MRKDAIVSIILYTLFVLSGSHVFGDEEKVLLLGGKAGWELVTGRQGVGEFDNLRPYRVMALSSAVDSRDPSLDLAISFDEPSPGQFRDLTGHYSLEIGPTLSMVDRNMARQGNGAARFTGAGSTFNESPLVVVPSGKDALLFSGQTFKDFSVEFWLYPMNAENGEQIMSWVSTRRTAQGESVFQRIQCNIVKSRLQWSFIDFFFSPDDHQRMAVTVTSSAPLIPKTWSHHLIRFDSGTGRMEYLVNGKIEGIVYTSSTGHEGGEVYNPIIGNGGRLALGSRYTGLLDEFRGYGRYLENTNTSKFPAQGGSFRTGPISMGTSNSWVKKIDVTCGLTSTGAGSLKNTYLGDRAAKFPDDAALQFFIRTSDNPYQWSHDDTGWISFVPGTELPDYIRGKWMQVMVNIYPGGDRESSPYVDEILITYMGDSAPPPPAMVQATPRDGAVDLSWKASTDTDLGGYLVYYGTSKGEYFGESAILGVSPIDVGKRTSIHIDGLDNGTLYYFAVAAYDRAGQPHIGEFSKEVAARPLKMILSASY